MNKLTGSMFKSPLLRVHPKIYREVKELLWNRAVFELGCINNAHGFLKSTSWVSRRLIRNFEIPLEFDCHFRIALSNMSKSISTMNAMLLLEEELNGTFSFDLLRSLGSARTRSCKMIIRILYFESYIELFNLAWRTIINSPNANISKEQIIQNYKDLFGELNQAWGGTLCLADTLVWENGRHVYRASPATVGIRKPLLIKG
ncbi:uncharacterized protein EAF01_000453 [Botrytis porri]|uniref:uncharacterized protein n=1 Tax=Botrytis porri TaxID=87229 RepID=UPI001900DEF5|nr:uncharacterized protein EAF01_000453 [Botrytis porri]KAF7914047.1 hypothetical protein EAF01_000453 [Botrytis porri]